MSEVYRHAASLLVLRPHPTQSGSCQLLLLHKPRKNDAWQLPQGGVESGEDVQRAALRELKEEAGMTDVEVLGTSPHVYQYDFPPSFRRFRPDNVCGQRIEYIFVRVPTDVSVNVDGKEIDGFIWVDPDELPKYIRRPEYLTLVCELFEEAMGYVRRTV